MTRLSCLLFQLPVHTSCKPRNFQILPETMSTEEPGWKTWPTEIGMCSRVKQDGDIDACHHHLLSVAAVVRCAQLINPEVHGQATAGLPQLVFLLEALNARSLVGIVDLPGTIDGKGERA